MAPLLKRLVIQWKRIVAVSGLLGSDYESFFEAIGLKFDTFKTIGNDSIEERRALGNDQNRLTICLFVEPKVSPNCYIFWNIIWRGQYCNHLRKIKELEMNQPSTTVNEINPLVPNSSNFRLHYGKESWSIRFHAPVEANINIQTQNSVFIAQKFYSIPNVQKTFCLKASQRNSSQDLNFISQRSSQLLFDLLSEPFVYFPGHLYVDVFIDWDTIINGAVTEPDFLLIMEFWIKRFRGKTVGFWIKLRKLRIHPMFLQNQNRDFVPVKQIDQKYI